jgi:hypothetical protein
MYLAVHGYISFSILFRSLRQCLPLIYLSFARNCIDKHLETRLEVDEDEWKLCLLMRRSSAQKQTL